MDKATWFIQTYNLHNSSGLAYNYSKISHNYYPRSFSRVGYVTKTIPQSSKKGKLFRFYYPFPFFHICQQIWIEKHKFNSSYINWRKAKRKLDLLLWGTFFSIAIRIVSWSPNSESDETVSLPQFWVLLVCGKAQSSSRRWSYGAAVCW